MSKVALGTISAVTCNRCHWSGYWMADIDGGRLYDHDGECLLVVAAGAQTGRWCPQCINPPEARG